MATRAGIEMAEQDAPQRLTPIEKIGEFDHEKEEWTARDHFVHSIFNLITKRKTGRCVTISSVPFSISGNN